MVAMALAMEDSDSRASALAAQFESQIDSEGSSAAAELAAAKEQLAAVEQDAEALRRDRDFLQDKVQATAQELETLMDTSDRESQVGVVEIRWGGKD